MEAELDIYRRTLDLFSTIDEAVEHIAEKTENGGFEICLRLLKDIRVAIDEINNSLGILIDRMDLVFIEGETSYINLVSKIEDLEQSYGNVDIDLLVNMVEHSLGESLQVWRREIIKNIGQALSS